MSGDGDEEVVQEKKVDPYAKLPKSTLDMNACKNGFYEFKKKGEQYFKEEFWKFLDDGYSVYKADYKYNDDFGGLDFINRNRVNGIVQGLDNSFAHKYMFGMFNL